MKDPRPCITTTIADLGLGESAWAVPWAMYVEPDGTLSIDGASPAWDARGGAVQMRVRRTLDGVIADISRCRYAPEWSRPDVGRHPIPVVTLRIDPRGAMDHHSPEEPLYAWQQVSRGPRSHPTHAWQDLAAEHLARRAQREADDWQPPHHTPGTSHETSDMMLGMSLLIGIGLLLGFILGVLCV